MASRPTTEDELGLPVQLEPKQRLVLLSEADEVFFGGGRGGMKTDTATWAIYSLATYYQNHDVPCVIAVFRRKNKQLEAELVRRALTKYPWPKASFYSAPRPGEWRLPLACDKGKPYEHGAVYVRYFHAEHPQDVYDYVGDEWAALFIDQVEEWLPEMVEILLGNLRSTASGVHPIARFFGNWGGPCHDWLINRFYRPLDDEGQPIETAPGQPFLVSVTGEVAGRFFRKEMTRMFVPSTFTDNPYLDQAAYAAWLKQQSPQRWRAWGLGDPEAFEGQMYEEWDKRVHVVEPHALPLEWKHYIGVDYGYAAPFCALWLARDPESGHVVVYDEAYQKKTSAERQMRLIAERTLSRPYPIAALVADYQMWAKESSGVSPADVYKRVARQMGFSGPVVPAHKNRIANIQNIHHHLGTWADGHPGLTVFSRCRNLLRELPALRPDPMNGEDIEQKRSTSDHAHDALMYGLSRLARPAGERPGAVNVRVKNPTFPEGRVRELWRT